MFKKYWKVKRLWTDEVEWILKWICYIQEKIDWANLSIWKEDWEIFVGSRTQIVWDRDRKEGFRGAVQYVNNHEWIKELFSVLEKEYNTKDIRLYWEWLIPHTITNYNIDSYKHFYLFDIEIKWENIRIDLVSGYANYFQIKTPYTFLKKENPNKEEIEKFVWESKIWPVWEWIVIKNLDFVNKYWSRCYAKIVWEKFKEDNMITFWWMQKWDNEVKILLKFCIPWRIIKIINKIEQNEDKDIELQDIPRIIWMVYHDILTEEINFISKQWIVDFKRLKKLCWKRTALISKSIILWEEISLAFDNI